MLTLRPSHERGHFDHGWLDTYHSFSFADYRDPAHMRFRVLRVINEDTVAPGEGFGTHPHQDMEILTYVISGALQHRDSMGTGSVITAGEVQRMTAGTGVTHSEMNASQSEPVHLLQIWVFPEAEGLPPSYEQKRFGPQEKTDVLKLVASRDGGDGSVSWHQDVSVFASLLGPGRSLTHELAPNRYAWLQLISGALTANGRSLAPGDGLAFSAESSLRISAGQVSEFLLFDLP